MARAASGISRSVASHLGLAGLTRTAIRTALGTGGRAAAPAVWRRYPRRKIDAGRAAWPSGAGDKTHLDRVCTDAENARSSWSQSQASRHRRRAGDTATAAGRRRERRQPTLRCPASVLDCDVLALDVAGFAEGFTERNNTAHGGLCDCPLTKPTTGIAGRCARAASGHAAVAPPRSAMSSPGHSMTSSAIASNLAGNET